jgi:hypothetical protein
MHKRSVTARANPSRILSGLGATSALLNLRVPLSSKSRAGLLPIDLPIWSIAQAVDARMYSVERQQGEAINERSHASARVAAL